MDTRQLELRMRAHKLYTLNFGFTLVPDMKEAEMEVSITKHMKNVRLTNE